MTREIEMEGKIYRPDYSTTSDARVVRTRDSLRHALLELLHSRPFEQITIREIAATAGIGYTTFFRHHPTRESLLEEIAAEEMRQLLEHLLSTFDAGDTGAQSLALCKYVAGHRAVWVTLLTGGAAGTLREEFIRIAKIVAQGSPHTTKWLPAEVEDATKVSVSRGLTVFYAVCSIGMAFGMAGPSPVCSNNTIY